MRRHLILALLFFLGIFGPLFGVSHEERSKDIFIPTGNTPLHGEDPRQDSACATTFHAIEHGIASWYGPGFHGRRMANGQTYDMGHYTVAHKTIRLGTEICVTNMANGRSLKAVVTDRGPYVDERVIDLSKRVADELGITEHGVGMVTIGIRQDRHQIKRVSA